MLDPPKAKQAFSDAIAEIKRIEDLMTSWRDSEITRINQAALPRRCRVVQTAKREHSA